jgi:hypothetical protein
LALSVGFGKNSPQLTSLDAQVLLAPLEFGQDFGTTKLFVHTNYLFIYSPYLVYLFTFSAHNTTVILSTILTNFCPESDQAIQIWATFVRTSTLGIFKKIPKICPDSPEAYLDFRQIFVRKRIRDPTGLSQVLG